MEKYLILIAVIMLFSLFMEKISKKLGLPSLLLFLFMGILSGNGIFLNDFVKNISQIEIICNIALVFIMFYGGFGTNIKQAKKVLKKAFLLASMGVFLTVLSLSIFIHYVLKFDFAESFLLASILGSTDAASVFNILRYKNLALKNNIDSLLEIESGSNDPFAYIATLIATLYLKGSLKISNSFIFLFNQVFFGILIAYIISSLYKFCLRKISDKNKEINQIIFLSAALLSYSISNKIGGNGFLSVYIVGIILGNFEFENKAKIVNFFDGITSLMQLLLFYLLGLLISPTKLLTVFFYGLVIFLFLTIFSRTFAINILLFNLKKYKENISISFAGIRGAASIVFAMSSFSLNLKNDIYHIVAVVVILSLIIQGTLLPYVVNKLDMLEVEGNILKTFNDYVEDKKIKFISSKISKNSYWNNKYLKDIYFPNDFRIILINRKNEPILPAGNIKLLEDDEIVLSGIQYIDDDVLEIKKVLVDKYHEWNNKKIFEIFMEENKKIVLISRSSKMIIPNGSLQIKENDEILISKIKKHSKFFEN